MNSMTTIYWRGCAAIVTKELKRIFRIWPQTIIPPAITMTLYFLIFGHFLGTHIGNVENLSYVEFITPGLILMSVIQNSYMSGSSPFFFAKMQRSIEEILVSPLPMFFVLLGYSLGGVVRGAIVGTVVTTISLFFTHLHVLHWGLMIFTCLFTSLLFSIAGVINGIFAKTFDDISIIPNFVLLPLTYLGGVFYSIASLPAFWKGLSVANPILYLVGTFRYAFYGVSSIHIAIGVSIIIGCVIGFFSFAWVLLVRGVGIRS